jgi:hypothetical protein
MVRDIATTIAPTPDILKKAKKNHVAKECKSSPNKP